MTETGIVETAAPHVAHVVQHAIRTFGVVLAQPALEQGRDLEGQPQHQIRCAPGPCCCRGLEQAFDLVVGQCRNHGGYHPADGHAGRREFPDRA